MAHLQELHNDDDDKITRTSLNQVTQSRDLLLGAAHDLQAQLDSERIQANQRIVELGEAATKSSIEAIDQILRIGTEEVRGITAGRDQLKSELMMTVNKAMINEDSLKQELHQLRRRNSTLQYEGIEEVRHARTMDEMNRRKLENLSDASEDYKTTTIAQESFINSLRAQLRDANDELGKRHSSSIAMRSSSSASADQRMTEMKMNIL